MTRWTCGLLAAAALAACTHRGDDDAAATVNPGIVATDPPDGATDVEPTAAVTIELAFPFGGSPDGAVVVSDGSNRLPGTFAPIRDGRWRWTPRAELPRGNTVVISSTSQGEVARFAVREASARRLFDLPGLTADAVLVWPNGRTAVHANARWFEVTDQGLVESFTTLPADAIPFGDGLTIHREPGATWQEQWLVRSGLDGERDRVPMPAVGGEIDVNSHGDVALFVNANAAPLEQRGFWLLPNDGFAWQHVGPYELSLHPALAEAPAPHLDDDRTVSLAYRVQEQGVFVRFEPGRLAAEEVTLPGQSVIHHWDASSDGHGWVVWDEAEQPNARVLRGMRYSPGEGFGEVTELRRWQLSAAGPTSVQCLDLRAGDGGSMLLDLLVIAPELPEGPYLQQFSRLERDGWTSLPTPHWTSTTNRRLVVSKGRAEVWALQLDGEGRELTFTRSRPGNQIELDRSLYSVPQPELAIWTWFAGLDDAGRLTVAMNLVSGGLPQGLRVLVFE